MSKPLTLSIVIPVYNEENHLELCLNAIAKQTVKPAEVIVVDNNCTDKSMDIARRYPFVKIIKEPKQGIAYSRNRGFDATRSTIIGRIDGDTVLPHNWVERVLRFYAVPANNETVLTGGGYFYNLRMPHFNGWVQSQLAYRANRFITGFYVTWGSNMALPRELWAAVRGVVCNEQDIHEDLDLAIHLRRLHFPITYDATLKVGVYLKRIWEDRNQQNEHLARWPQTLKKHGYRRWWLSIAGNIVIKYVIQPYGFMAEGVSRLIGRKNLPPPKPW